MNMKTCSDCNEELPIDKFYVRPSGVSYSRCKECHRKVTKKHPTSSQEPAEHEKRTVNWLQSQGIIAFHGKHLRLPDFKHVDVIAFGCLKVECKLPQKDNRIYFTHKQRRTRYHADVVVVERDEISYSVFPITYAGFYEGGQLRRVIPVAELECDTYHNRIDIIETVFHRKRMALMKQAMGTSAEQLTLFPKAS